MLKKLTQNYIQAFNDKNLNALSALFDEHVVLEDPIIKRVEGKAAVLSVLEGIFNNVGHLSFEARNIFVDGGTSLIEFRLKLGDQLLRGAAEPLRRTLRILLGASTPKPVAASVA